MIIKSTWKKTSVTTRSHPSEIASFWTPPPPHPLGISVAIRGGVWIVSGNTHYTYIMKGKKKS